MLVPLDYTSTTTAITTLKNGLNAAGILTTTHRETSTNLIVTLARSTRPLRFAVTTAFRWSIFYGTAYTSGDVVDNSVTLAAYNANTGQSAGLIVTEDVVAFSEYRGGVNTCGFLLANLDNLASTEVMWAWVNGSTASIFHNTTEIQLMGANFFSVPMISAANKYYTSEIPTMANTGLLLSEAVKGVKALHKAANYGTPYEIYTDDIVIPGGGANAVSNYIPLSLYIPDGVAWEPA